MAELILKIGDSKTSTGFKDGDIIHGMNNLRIHTVHAQHICHKDKIGFGKDGLRPANSLTEMYLAKVRQFKFERISNTEVRRTDQWTLTEEVFSDVANAEGKHIDVEEFITRRLKHPKHIIFGVKGKEVWYGGRTLISSSIVSDIWNAIEAKTQYRKAYFGKFPWGSQDLKLYLAISVDDFDNTERDEMESSIFDDQIVDPTLIAKRRYKVIWQDLTGLDQATKDNINNPDVEVDIRENITYTRSMIVQSKSLKVS